MAKKKKSRRNKSPKRKIPVEQPVSLFRRWFTIGSIAVLALLLSAQVPLTQNYTATPLNVLGDEDKKEENKEEKREENKGSENKREEQKKTEERKQEEQKKQFDQQRKIMKSINSNSSGTSTSLREDFKIKNETIMPNGLKTKSEFRGNKQEIEMDEDELDELEEAVENELKDDDLLLESTDDNKLSVTKNQVTAITDFPL